MNETQMTEASLQASLHDIRLPAEAAGGMLGDLFAALTLAGLMALVVVGLWRSLGNARPAQRLGGWQAKLEDLATEDEATRRIALLHLLKTHAPARFAAMRGSLYTAKASPDSATLEAELRRHG